MHTKIDYPAHIYDPWRREIAVRYLRHEMRKLLPSLREQSVWQTIDTEIANWYEANPTLMPVRDFWNGLHGISMGFRLKNIVSWVTSANLEWQDREVPIDELYFGSTIDELKPIGETPSAVTVREWFFASERQEILAAARKKHEERSAQTMPRDDFPIIVIRKENVLRVTDGNRRLLRAILNERKTIFAVVAEPLAPPSVHEQWVPTQNLIDLVSFHRYWKALGRDMTAHIATILAEMIKDSTVGRVEFFERSVSKTVAYDQPLIEAVRARLLEMGVEYKA